MFIHRRWTYSAITRLSCPAMRKQSSCQTKNGKILPISSKISANDEKIKTFRRSERCKKAKSASTQSRIEIREHMKKGCISQKRITPKTTHGVSDSMSYRGVAVWLYWRQLYLAERNNGMPATNASEVVKPEKTKRRCHCSIYSFISSRKPRSQLFQMLSCHENLPINRHPIFRRTTWINARHQHRWAPT